MEKALKACIVSKTTRLNQRKHLHPRDCIPITKSYISTIPLEDDRPPPTGFSTNAYGNVEQYGATTVREEYIGRGFVSFATWYHQDYKYAVVQLELNQKAVAVFNEFFAFSLINIGGAMYAYDTSFYLKHTQKKPLKRSNFRYLSEIASIALHLRIVFIREIIF